MTTENPIPVQPNLDALRRIGSIGGVRGDKLPASLNRGGIVARIDFFSTKDVAPTFE